MYFCSLYLLVYFFTLFIFCILLGSEVGNYMVAGGGRGSQFCEWRAERLLSILEFDLKLGPRVKMWQHERDFNARKVNMRF